jgi:hypothetical protein
VARRAAGGPPRQSPPLTPGQRRRRRRLDPNTAQLGGAESGQQSSEVTGSLEGRFTQRVKLLLS